MKKGKTVYLVPDDYDMASGKVSYIRYSQASQITGAPHIASINIDTIIVYMNGDIPRLGIKELLNHVPNRVLLQSKYNPPRDITLLKYLLPTDVFSGIRSDMLHIPERLLKGGVGYYDV